MLRIEWFGSTTVFRICEIKVIARTQQTHLRAFANSTELSDTLIAGEPSPSG
jgi:hypothetical protein